MHVAGFTCLSFTATFSTEPFTTQTEFLKTPSKKALENSVKETAGNQHFLLFPHCFLTYQWQSLLFEPHVVCGLQMLLIWFNLIFSFIYSQHNFVYYYEIEYEIKREKSEKIS